MNRPLGCLPWDRRPHVTVSVTLSLVFPPHFLPSPELLAYRMEEAARLACAHNPELPAGVAVHAQLEGYHINEDYKHGT